MNRRGFLRSAVAGLLTAAVPAGYLPGGEAVRTFTATWVKEQNRWVATAWVLEQIAVGLAEVGLTFEDLIPPRGDAVVDATLTIEVAEK